MSAILPGFGKDVVREHVERQELGEQLGLMTAEGSVSLQFSSPRDFRASSESSYMNDFVLT